MGLAVQGFIPRLPSTNHNIDHRILFREITKKVHDPRVIKAISRYLTRGYTIGNMRYHKKNPNIGTYQGDVISPLLANIYLDPLDKELEKSVPFVRFADDIKCFKSSYKSGANLKLSLTDKLERDFKLRVNQNKTKVIPYTKADIYGFSITMCNGNPIVLLSSKAEKKYPLKLQEIIEDNQGLVTEEILSKVNKFIKGWMEYYKIISDPQPLKQLDMLTQELITEKLKLGPLSLYNIYKDIHKPLVA